MAMAWVAGFGCLEAAYGRMTGSVEAKAALDYHVLNPTGWNGFSLGLNSGFFVRSYLSLQILVQMDAVVFSQLQPDHTVFGRRRFEVAPGIRWWIVPEWRLSPYAEVYFSIPMLWRTKGTATDDLFVNQGVRYGGGVVFDWYNGYGISAGMSLMHYFKEEFLTFMEWSLSGIVVF
jgi:hypothetical protein